MTAPSASQALSVSGDRLFYQPVVAARADIRLLHEVLCKAVSYLHGRFALPLEDQVLVQADDMFKLYLDLGSQVLEMRA